MILFNYDRPSWLRKVAVLGVFLACGACAVGTQGQPIEGATTVLERTDREEGVTAAPEHQSDVKQPAVAASRSAPRSPVGVYYYPGWQRSDANGPIAPDPWEKIPEALRPIGGAYDENLQETTDRQLRQMVSAGIDYVAVDWYWNRNAPRHDHWIRHYLASTVPNKPKFTLLFDNNYAVGTPAEWTACLQYWVANYFGRSNYYKVDGKPLVMIYAPYSFRHSARSDAGVVRMLAEARAAEALARPGSSVFFVGNTFLQSNSIDMGDSPGSLAAMGFDGMSAYNLVSGSNWQQLVALYDRWYSNAGASKLPFIAPVSTGWNNTIWQPQSGRNIASPDDHQFRAHLLAARAAGSDSSRALGVIINAWNEYGEGTVIEPSGLAGGMSRLQAISDIFAR